jgi:hypothetical protein
MNTLLLYHALNAGRREKFQTSRRLCLISVNAASGSARRAVACAVQSSWLRTVGDEHSVGVITVMVETNSPSLPTMLAPAAEPT